MNDKELDRALSQHEKWLNSGGKEGSRLFLPGCDLSGRCLVGSELSKADLNMANLSGTNLFLSCLYKTSLYRAKLSKARLCKANFYGSDLRYADLSDSDLTETQLIGSLIQGVNFSGTIYENDIPVMINTEFCSILKCKAYIQIGQRRHTQEEWSDFNDSEISKLGEGALVFWRHYKNIILS